ncbi:hypothetical protein [Pantoea ananatis]|uniref:hypothetical protein n=1 Tax=Pantoea ananas TaxID=553 RepID=UPI0024B7B2D6|nr:hypothetical protein [Pantoea ananatis]MDJ0030962.1 hypothetical protein [Pantoea ananatis]
MSDMIKIARFLRLYLLLLAVFFIGLFYCKISYSFNDFNAYMTVLIGVSGMIFTIMGIWIAFIYPNALKRIADPKKIESADFSEGLEDTKRLEAIVASILKSLMIIVISMFLFLAKIVFFNTVFYIEFKDVIKTLCLSLVFVLTYAQLESVYQVIKANILFIDDLHNKREQREIDQDI